MSQYEFINVDEETGRETRWLFGWDHPLQSYFLQVHDSALSEEENPFVRYGASKETELYEVEDLVRVARQHGKTIPYDLRIRLYGDKDDGR